MIPTQKKDLIEILRLMDNAYELFSGVMPAPETRRVVSEGLREFSRARTFLEDALNRIRDTGDLTLDDVVLTDEVILHIAHQYDAKYTEIADKPLGAVERHHQACTAVRKTVRHYLRTNQFRHYKDIELFERSLGILPVDKEA